MHLGRGLHVPVAEDIAQKPEEERFALATLLPHQRDNGEAFMAAVDEAPQDQRAQLGRWHVVVRKEPLREVAPRPHAHTSTRSESPQRVCPRHTDNLQGVIHCLPTPHVVDKGRQALAEPESQFEQGRRRVRLQVLDEALGSPRVVWRVLEMPCTMTA